MDKMKILIAEDNSFSRKFYDTYVSGDIFSKQFAVNGFEALEIYGNWKPDILLLDLMMPVMSGQEVLREIREARRDIATTIIISSLSSHRDDVALCARFGVQGYLVKPLDPREISRTLLDLYTKANPKKAAEIGPLVQRL